MPPLPGRVEYASFIWFENLYQEAYNAARGEELSGAGTFGHCKTANVIFIDTAQDIASDSPFPRISGARAG